MSVTWLPVETIPPKGMPWDEKRTLEGKAKRGRWVAFLDDYLTAGFERAEAVYDSDTHTADALRSALNAAIRAHERFAGLYVIRRGDSVYVASGERAWSVNPQKVKDDLIVADTEGECVVMVRDLTDQQQRKLYRAYHYHRTSMGLGHLRVSLRDDEIRIYDTERGDESCAGS